MTFVQDALAIVILAVVAGAAVVAVVLAFAARGAHDHIGRSGLSLDRAPAESTNDPTDTAALLASANARRAAHGRPPLTLADLDPARADEGLAAHGRPPLTPDPARADDGLRAEIRAVVEARNARRSARGLAPLDVEVEVERRLRAQDG